MTRPRRFHPLDTPKAGRVRVTNTTTGETRWEDPLTIQDRRDLARFNRKHITTKRRHPWKTPSE